MTPLANHLWQSTLFAAAVWLLTIVLRRNRAAARHSLWVAASIKFVVPFSLLVSAGSLVEWRARPAISSPPLPAPLVEIGSPFASPRAAAPTAGRESAGRVTAALWVIWFAGFGVGAFSWARQWRRVRTAAASGSGLALGLTVRAVAIGESWAPGVFGILRPALLLPEGILARLRAEELDAIIAHELCHIRRRDNLWAAIHTAVQTVFWFYPPVRWIGARMLDERERACDEAVAQIAEPRTYAEGILRVCRWYAGDPPACMAGACGSKLKERVVGIVTYRPAPRLSGWKRALLGGAAAATVAGPFAIGVWNAPAGRAQTVSGNRARFEVASVRPFKGGPENRFIRSEHGTVTIRQQSLRECIRWAYNLQNADLIEGPGWMDTEEFDITAKAPADASMEQVRLMLQELLTERFRLALRHRTDDRNIYALVPGKGSGRNLRLVDTAPEQGFRVNTNNERLVYHMVSEMAQLVQILPAFLDRPVVDRTGLTGVYEITLDVEMNPDFQLPQRGTVFRGFGFTPGVFSAVEELGLKLAPAKGPVEILIVDHAERPTQN
jgi:uncharacterized protein (TIGR03435 family)